MLRTALACLRRRLRPPRAGTSPSKANISGDLIDVYEAQLDQEAKEEEEEAQAQRELDELEAEEEMPPP